MALSEVMLICLCALPHHARSGYEPSISDECFEEHSECRKPDHVGAGIASRFIWQTSVGARNVARVHDCNVSAGITSHRTQQGHQELTEAVRSLCVHLESLLSANAEQPVVGLAIAWESSLDSPSVNLRFRQGRAR